MRYSLSVVAVWFAATVAAHAQLTVFLTPSVASPSPVGTVITWTASVAGASGNTQYRFRAGSSDTDFHLVRDFSPTSTLDWTEIRHEGLYEVEVTARDQASGATAVTSSSYQFTSRADAGPAIGRTPHPLVFIYSAPPCFPGSRMRVQFTDPDGFVQATPYQPCQRGLSMNFYLAGLRANATYTAHHTIDSGVAHWDAPDLTFTTAPVSPQVPATAVLQAPAQPVDGVLLHSCFMTVSYAVDPAGHVIWYYPAQYALLTRPVGGGRFLAIVANEQEAGYGQNLREFDLVGNTLRETNTARLNEQLSAMGKRTITILHHDAVEFSNGNIAVLGTTEQFLNGVQGSGNVDVLGDMILLLDRDLQVIWTWDALDHLDPHRMATLHETCPGLGCPPLTLASHANDWLHGNALVLTPDGNLLYSTRHQDWIVKIDFRNGQGTGDILWRLGKDGDFQIVSNDPSPWFSHQHGPGFSPIDGTLLAIFDDSNLRHAADPNAHSRGEVLQLDEPNRTATLRINVDLGGFSFALGKAQALRNGDYHYGAGWLPDNTSNSVDVDSSGNIVGLANVKNPEFRSFQMKDLYTPDSELPPTGRRLPIGPGSRCRVGACASAQSSTTNGGS